MHVCQQQHGLRSGKIVLGCSDGIAAQPDAYIAVACAAVAGMSKFLPGRSASAVRQAVNVKLIQEGRLNEVQAR
jgi:hypothetical protein